ncbi:MAG: type II toxin-antitoxin system RelE/ParE family toxin [Candidatus Liptonbacteria bacterium]|nr:type II toxin-antitoxin system RelE/ParE family toxin [Candidatus Liptonbacteria bacterium]
MYRLVLPKKVQREISEIDKRYIDRVRRTLSLIEQSPSVGKKLEGKFKLFHSYQVWPYRIIYKIKEKNLIVIKIGHRQSVYK